MDGYIKPDMERRMRALVELRDRIVHGDLSIEPTSAEVLDVLAAIEATLSG
jgi:HAMP domain-containing protein